MKNWVSIAITAAVALAIGYSLRPASVVPAPVPVLPNLTSLKPVSTSATAPEAVVPRYPKPDIELPVPSVDDQSPSIRAPEPLVGSFPSLPNASLGGPSGAIGPLAPEIPTKLPTADLNADEALARRTVLKAGGEIVASSDAKDSTGKVGKTLVIEVDGASAGGLRASLRKALGDRIVLSDAGTVSSPSPALKKAEEELAAAKKKVEQARVDFLPQAPALRQIEEDYLAQERSVAEQRKSSSRQRLNILLRPTLGS